MENLICFLLEMLFIKTQAEKKKNFKIRKKSLKPDKEMRKKMKEREKSYDGVKNQDHLLKFYRMMRIRMKISYAAWRKSKSIYHHLFETI
jgi:hypothetical protein